MTRSTGAEALYRDAFQIAAAGIAVTDPEGRIEEANAAYCSTSGYTLEQLRQRTVYDLMHPEDREASRAAAQRLLDGTLKSDVAIQRYVTRAGDVIWAHASRAVLRRDGQPRRLVTVVEDITQQHAAERKARQEAEDLYQALRSSEAALRDLVREKSQILEAIPHMVWVADAEGRYQFCNQRWRDFTGLAAESCHVDAWVGLIHPEDREDVLSSWRRSLGAGRGFEVEHRMRRSDGEYRWLLAKAEPLLDDAGRLVRWFGASTDIHHQKTAEAALRRTEKLAAAGRLAATVAHEINNPLEAVTNLLYLAIHMDSMPAEAAGYLEQASEELRRVAHIVSQTLGFYRDSGTPSQVSMGTLVRDVLYLYQRKMNTRQIRLCTRIEEDVAATVISGEIRQVIANLVANAIDATEPGGVISAEVRADDEHVELTVADTGQGIAPEHLPRIFEPFYTTKKDVGTGLGLWVSKRVIEKHSGTLSVKSSTGAEDHGTVFTVTLPRKMANAERVAA